MALLLLSLLSAQGWHHVLPSGHHHRHGAEQGHDHTSVSVSQAAMRQELGSRIAAGAALLAPSALVLVEPRAETAPAFEPAPPVSARGEPPRPPRGPPSRA